MIFFKLFACFFILISSTNCNKRNKEIQVFNENRQYDEEFLNGLENQLDRNSKKKITLVNTSTEIQDGLHESSSDKKGQLKNKYKLKIDVEFDLDAQRLHERAGETQQLLAGRGRLCCL